MKQLQPYENTNMNFDALKKGFGDADPKGTKALMNAVMSQDAIREMVLRDIVHKRPSQYPAKNEVEC